MRRAIGILICLILSFCATSAYAQLTSSATVTITARIPGSISLSLRSTPVAVAVSHGAQSGFTVPLTVEWNLDPRETPAFSVAAFFREPNAALLNTVTATVIPAENISARWGDQNQFVPFQRTDGTVVLFHTAVLPDLRRDTQSRNLELKIDDIVAAGLPDGDYQGVLYLEVRNY
jgi:hypothetical protein